MGLIDYENEIGEIQPVEDLPQKLYNKQLKDITNISHTDWYKEIKRYWTEVKEWAEAELKKVKPEFLNIIQTKCLIAEEFVWFLENLEKATAISKKAKK